MTSAAPRSAPPERIEAEIKRQQQIHMVDRLTMMAQVNAFNSSIVAVVVWPHVHHAIVVVWLSLMLTAAVLQYRGGRRMSRLPPPTSVSGKMLERGKLWSFFAGLLWGGVVVFFHTPDNVPVQMFLAVLVGGMSAGTVMLLSPIPSVNRYFLIAAFTPLAITFALYLTPLHLAVSLLGVMYGFTLYKGSLKSYDTLREMVRSSMERERAQADLIDAIESTNDGFALLDADKNVVVANLRFRTWFESADEVADDPPEGRLRAVPGGRWVYSALRPTTRSGFVSVHVDVTELKRREQELVAEKKRAEAADRAKTHFLANISHELRTPLNAIIGFSQIMSDQLFGEIGDPRYVEYAGDIEKSGAHLLSIINDILDLSKLESAAYRISTDEVDIDETVGFAVSVCERDEQSPEGRDVELEIDGDLPLLHLDARALKQILINLIGNAVKFTPAEGRVGVKARLAGAEGVEIVVWDEGIGIPADKIDDVRRPFVQVESAYARSYQGSGLGLAISCSLVELQGGVLEIQSEEGSGTRVTVRFPAALFVDEGEPAAEAGEAA